MIDLNIARDLVRHQEIAQGLERYEYLMNQLHKVDVSTDAEYQHVYTLFYRMKPFRSDDFLMEYFRYMEQAKNEPNLMFESAFPNIYRISGSMEMSFCSKMIHTINPSQPIWDKVVATDHFHFTKPYSRCKKPIEACITRYIDYSIAFAAYSESEEGRDLIAIFDGQFPHSNISNAKKIDFILWQDRSPTS